MLFKYKYVNHEIEKFQIYCDFLFLEVWVKARGPFDAIKLDRCPELKNIYELLHFDDGEWARFFNGSIETIYSRFLNLGKSQRRELKRWYLINNRISSLCINNSIEPIKYSDLQNQYPTLLTPIRTFYERLYGTTSPFILAAFGNLKTIKSSHYEEFINVNFDGHEGICPFCGLNSIKGNDHSKLEAYDHFLPKGVYPFNSINFKNLAPMCHECNSSYKLVQNPVMNIDPLSGLMSRRRAFYPYSIDQWNLHIGVTLLNNDLKSLASSEIEITVQSLGKDEEIASWMEVFGIDERYKAKLLGKHAGKKWYNTLKDGINNAKKILKKDDLTKDEWFALLINQCDEDVFSDCNFLKKPFYEECVRININ
ncbi:MAG: hypothetical protein V4577_31740 [Bacteroidota bacterium]